MNPNANACRACMQCLWLWMPPEACLTSGSGTGKPVRYTLLQGSVIHLLIEDELFSTQERSNDQEAIMNEATPISTRAAQAVVFALVLSACFIAVPAERTAVQSGMQPVANAPAGDGESCPRGPGEQAGDGESCPRNPGEQAGQPPLVLVIPMLRPSPSPLQPAVYIEVSTPATGDAAVVRYSI